MIGPGKRLLSAIPLACAGALVIAAGANAAVTAAGVPVLTSPAFASPVTLHWTPGTSDDGGHGDDHGHGHHHRGISQLVVRAPAACPMTFRTARVVGYYQDGAEHDFSDAVADGTYCYSIVTADGASFAGSPSLTVTVNAAAVQPVPAPAPAPVAPAVAPATPADMIAPTAPAAFKVTLGRARAGTARVPVTVRWSLPADADLDHVEVVLNAKHAPTTLIDGAVVYRGKGTSAQVTVTPGRTTFIALFAVDAAGNTSKPTLQALRAPVASSLRPLDGSKLTGTPLLSWKPVAGASYYNVQLFRNGTRVLVAWPGQPSFRLPAGTLRPGTYVWFVWPAVAPKHAPPKFAARIGRGTFTYVS